MSFSCSSKKNKKVETVIVNEQSQPVQKKKKKNVNKYANLINNQNVIQKLKDFGQSNKETLISIETTYGNIKLKLYDDTPLHRSNFVMLVKKGFYDSTLFYRVIRNFMIQGGNSDDQKMFKRIATIGNYKIPAEIRKNHIHKRGALAMAVQEQYCQDASKHDHSSSAYNFYIKGHKYTMEPVLNYEVYTNEVPDGEDDVAGDGGSYWVLPPSWGPILNFDDDYINTISVYSYYNNINNRQGYWGSNWGSPVGDPQLGIPNEDPQLEIPNWGSPILTPK